MLFIVLVFLCFVLFVFFQCLVLNDTPSVFSYVYVEDNCFIQSLIMYGLSEWKRICAMLLYRLFIYVFPVIKDLELGPINRFIPTTILRLSQARICMSSVIRRVLFIVYRECRWEEVIARFFFGGIVDLSLFKLSFHDCIKTICYAIFK